MIRIDRIAIGIVWGLFVWPEVRDALMETLFCNSSLQNEMTESFFFGFGTCGYGFLVFFILLPALTVASYWPYIRKFIKWINDMRS